MKPQEHEIGKTYNVSNALIEQECPCCTFNVQREALCVHITSCPAAICMNGMHSEANESVCQCGFPAVKTVYWKGLSTLCVASSSGVQ
jgi:hypothetical protein